MADVVSSQILQDGDRFVIVKFLNVSDGTGELDVLKVDVSTLAPLQEDGRPCTSVRIEQIWLGVSGMQVSIEWEATTHVIAWIIASLGTQEHDFSIFGGLTNNAGAGKTGNILFTTIGANAGDTYSILFRLIKQYD